MLKGRGKRGMYSKFFDPSYSRLEYILNCIISVPTIFPDISIKYVGRKM